jgi:CheY-like chemotaxis protein
MLSDARSVLVVDDFADIREFLTLVLEDRGYRVRAAEHGAAALETIKRETFGVILLDIQMPVMDGLEFVRNYRSLPGHQAHLVVMTAGHDAALYAEHVGADRYLAKPFELDAVVTLVDELTDGCTCSHGR